jgi:PAS domain S-box-containing protein
VKDSAEAATPAGQAGPSDPVDPGDQADPADHPGPAAPDGPADRGGSAARGAAPRTVPPAAPAPDRRVIAQVTVLARLAAVLAGLAGAGVLGLGWALEIPALRGLGPGLPAIPPNTALGLLLLAIALPFLGERPGTGWARPGRWLAAAAAVTVLAAAAVTLAQYVLGGDLGVDHLLFDEDARRTSGPAGRSSNRPFADAAAGLGLLGAGALATLRGTRRSVLAGQLLAVCAALIGLTALYQTLIGLVYGERALREPSSVAGMAAPTALAVTLLALSLLAARPTAGLNQPITSDGVGGVLGRRLMLAAVIVPPVIACLPPLAELAGLEGLRLLVAFVISGNVVAFGAVTFLAARAAARLETGQLAAEHAARTGHDQIQSLIDNTSAVIYVRDLAGRYLLVNREYERLFEVRRERIVGLTDHDLFPHSMADDFRTNDLTALAAGRPIQMEEDAPGNDSAHTYITVKFPLLDRDGEPYAVCGISTDITDRKRAEEEVRRLNAELEQRVKQRTAELEASTRELDAFAYSVSHDLRAPLRSLDGFSQMLLEDYGETLDETGRDYLHRLRAGAQRMAQLIDDLLDLSRATRVELRRERVDLSGLARTVVGELRAADPGRDVEVTVADHLVASGDPHLIRLVLQNLLSNAWKFTSKRSGARIEVGARDGGGQGDGERVFLVRDNGAGFDMRYAGKLFDPFQRLHAAAEFEGTGVGLAIVQRIVRRHGGRVWAESEPDRGAAFWFTLPAHLSAPPLRSPPRDQSRSHDQERDQPEPTRLEEERHERLADPVGRGQPR